MIPRATTFALVEHELAPALQWAERRSIELTWHPEILEVRAVLTQRATGEKYFLAGQLDGYRAVPPAWEFRDAQWSDSRNKRNYPRAAVIPGVGNSSMFHPNPVICAAFNRLAYQQNGGPHGDWGGPEQWLHAGAGYVQAHTLGDMLAAIARDLAYSEGRMV